MSGSPSRLTEPDTTLPGTPARKRHVRATNAWAQEQALEAERGFSMGSHDKQQENVWSLANPRDASTGGPSGGNGNNYLALSSRQNNENGTTSNSSQATIVREKNSWAQEALNLNDVGKLLDENNVQYTSSACAEVGALMNDNEKPGPAVVKPNTKRVAGTFLPSSNENKNRSAIEPILSKPFSMTRKMSFKGLRAALTGIKAVPDVKSAGKVLPDTPSIPSLRLDKASRVLGLKFQSDWQSGDFLPSPPSAQDVDFSGSYRDHIFDQQAPKGFGLKPNDTPALRKWAMPQVPEKSRISSRQPSKDEVESDGIFLGHGNLSPTKSGSYGTVGKLEVVGANFARVASQQGIIETIGTEGEENVHGNQYPAGHPSSAVYSPSVYEGVWEKHPEVGRTLPPFSPKLPHQAEDYHQLIDEKLESDDGASASPDDVSGVGAKYAPRSSVLTLASIDSIATSEESSGRDSAEVLPLFADDSEKTPVAIAHNSNIPETNAVPPPPNSFPNYQASAPVGFAQAMINLHHHMEFSNDRLHRLIEDQNNRTHDELIRRCESLEEKIQKNGKGASKHDLNGLKNEFDILGHDLHMTVATGTETKRMIHTVLAKVAALDELLKNSVCKCGSIQPQRSPDQQGPFLRGENTRFFSDYGAPNVMTSPGYIRVPVQYNGNQFANFGNYNTYENSSTPQFHNGPSTNFEPRSTETTEEYYRTLGHPQMMRAEIPEIQFHEDLTFSRKDQDCTIPFGIKGPNGVLYELPSFMRMTSDGPVIFDESPVSTSTEGIAGGGAADDEKERPKQRGPSFSIPVGLDGPDGIKYDIPSFMSYNAEGNIILDQFDEDACPVAASTNENDETLIKDKNVVGVGQGAAPAGPVPVGIRMPHGIVYELPSFLRLNEDGQAEVMQDKDSAGAEDAEAVPQAGPMPIGIRMDNGVVYELPTFMRLNEGGQAEIDLQDELLTDNGIEVPNFQGTIPVGLRGPDGMVHEEPSFLRINDDGPKEVTQQEESSDGQNIHQTDGVPMGIRIENGVLYELPTFMRMNEEGQAEIFLQDEAVADDVHDVALSVDTVSIGVRGPDEVLYELSSSLSINDGGLEQAVQQEGSENVTHAAPMHEVPIGIRMNNGVVYEVPSFMSISEDGLVEVDQYDESGTEITTATNPTASDYSAWTEGPQGIWVHERAGMEDIFHSPVN